MIEQLADTPGAQPGELDEGIAVPNILHLAHISFDVGLDVGRVKVSRCNVAVVNARVAAPENHAFILLCARFQFGKRKRQQVQYGSTTRQGLADFLHQQEVRRASQNELELPVLIYKPLEVGEQVRGVLDFIQDGAGRIVGEEPARIGQCKLADVRLFQGDIGQVGKGGADKSRLAGLAWPGEGNDLEFLRQGDDFCLSGFSGS